MKRLKFRVQVASLKTLYALVQIRAAWRAAFSDDRSECLTPDRGSDPSSGKK